MDTNLISRSQFVSENLQPQSVQNQPIATSNPTPIQPMVAGMGPEKPKKKSPLKKFILVVGGFVILLVVLLGLLFYKGIKDAPKVQERVTSFMQNVSSGNYETAYSLTSKDFKRVIPKEQFSRAMALLKAQFTEFQSQKQTGFYVQANIGKPSFYQYSAEVIYLDGDKGELMAVFVKEDGDYKILEIKVNVSIERAEKFQQKEKDSVLGASTKK